MLGITKKNIIISIIIFILFLIGSTQVEASNYPNGELIVDNDKFLYDATGNQAIETVPGTNYNPDTNMLTLNGYNGGRITAYNMLDFKINIIGDNTITHDVTQFPSAIYVVLGSLEITGTGTLNIVATNTSEYIFETTHGSIRNHDATLEINGPTINILNSVNSGIVSGFNVTIKNGNVNINTTGEYAICSERGNIEISGNSVLTAKTTLDDNKAVTLNAENGTIKLSTEGQVKLEKANNGTFSLPELSTQFETYDSVYEYDIVKDKNNVSYTYKSRTNKNLIDFIEIDGTSIYPESGTEPKFLFHESEDYEIVNQVWCDEELGEMPDTIIAGKEYSFSLRLLPKNMNYFSDSTVANITCFDETFSYFEEDDGSLVITALLNLKTSLKYKITIVQVDSSIELNRDVIEVIAGEKFEKAIVTPDGYEVKSVKVDGYEVLLDNKILSLNEIKNDTEVIVELNKIETEQNNTKNEIIDTESDNSLNPQTGDNIIFFVLIFAISIIGIFITTKCIAKSKNNN